MTRIYLILETVAEAIGLAAFIAVGLLWCLIFTGGLPI